MTCGLWEAHLNAEVHNVALLGRQAHLEGLLGAGQPCCTAAVYGAEDLGIPHLLEVGWGPHLVLNNHSC